MTKLLFAYGSLMNDEVTNALLQSPLERQPATLNGYRRVQVKNALYPGAFADVDAVTEGQLISGLTDDQWQRLDVFEGEYYERTAVTVLSAACEPMVADTYVFKDAYRHLLNDSPWCNDTFRDQSMSRFIATYTGYLAAASEGS